MWPLVTDRVAWSVDLSVTLVSPAKMAELIEAPFGLRIRLGPRNDMLDGVSIPHGKGQFLGGRMAHCKVQECSSVICSEMAELIEMPFGLLARMAPRNHV